MHIQNLLLVAALPFAFARAGAAAAAAVGSGAHAQARVAAASRASTISAFSDGQTPFATFEANNHSYAMGFKMVMTGLVGGEGDYCNGRLHNAPQPLFEAIMKECSIHGAIIPTLEPENPTNQLLVASAYYNCGQDFVFVDWLDREDDMQQCIQHINKAAIQRGFGTLVDEKGVSIKSRISAASSLGVGSLGVMVSAMTTLWALLI